MTGSATTMNRPASKAGKIDAACAEAVELAKAAVAEAVGDDQLGDYLGCEAEGERVVTHYFACTHPGYVGWRWSVTVARASRQRAVTVDEIVVRPGNGALVAPEWLPWHERVLPGDLGPGDLLPTTEDDPRLAPGYTDTDEASDDADVSRAVADELGLGRRRILSPLGRDEAVDRWYAGSHGPEDPIAVASTVQCSTCGFFVRLTGPVGRLFGVCANEYSPRDGQAVSLDFGCGAHSEVVGTPTPPETLEPVFDTMRYDDV